MPVNNTAGAVKLSPGLCLHFAYLYFGVGDTKQLNNQRLNTNPDVLALAIVQYRPSVYALLVLTRTFFSIRWR